MPLDEVVDFDTSPNGRLYAVDAGNRIAFLGARGKWRVFRTAWRETLAWAPDGCSVLVARGARLGLLSPADGSVREVGRVHNGQVYGAAWVGAAGH